MLLQEADKVPASAGRSLGEMLAESLRPLTSSGRAPKCAASGGGPCSSGDECGTRDGVYSAHGKGRRRDGVELGGAAHGGDSRRGATAEDGAESELVRRLLKTVERLQWRLAAAESSTGPGDHAGAGGGGGGWQDMEALRQELEAVKEENAKLRVENGNMYVRARAPCLSLLPPSPPPVVFVSSYPSVSPLPLSLPPYLPPSRLSCAVSLSLSLSLSLSPVCIPARLLGFES